MGSRISKKKKKKKKKKRKKEKSHTFLCLFYNRQRSARWNSDISQQLVDPNSGYYGVPNSLGGLLDKPWSTGLPSTRVIHLFINATYKKNYSIGNFKKIGQRSQIEPDSKFDTPI